jgi:hypothetical protein
MATAPSFPTGTEPTGTAWKTRSGVLVHRIREVARPDREGWFCTGCLGIQAPNSNFKERIAAVAQAHANACTAIQV